MGGEQSKPSSGKEDAKIQSGQRRQNENQAKNLKIQKTKVSIEEKVRNFQQKERRLENKVDKLKQNAKILMTQDKKKDARKLIEEAARLKKQIQNISVRRKALQNKNMELQDHQMNKIAIDAMEQANQYTKQDYTGRLEELIIDSKENKMIQDEINGKMKDMVGNSSDEQKEDEMMEELMREIDRDNKKKISQKQPGKGVQINQASKQKVQDNDLDAMLNAL